MFCEKCFATLRKEDKACYNCRNNVNHQEQSLLKQWSQLAKTPYFQELAAVKAGEDAENWLQGLVEKHINYKGAHTFAGKRVSTRANKARKEIDLIVVTLSKTHIIEAKNWSGQIFPNGQNWIHSKRDGSQKAYPTLVAYNNEKKEILLSYLKENNIVLPHQQISQKIIFLNKNLALDGSIANNPNVITLGKLAGYLVRAQKLTDQISIDILRKR